MSDTPTYIVAVSGGIDSVCLLHMLTSDAPQIHANFAPATRFVVAHVNHGMRGDLSDRDEAFVRDLAGSYGLEFTSTRLSLGTNASEEEARDARYEFLEKMRELYRATGIVLAHHKGDVLETAIINSLRGTGRRGLTSLRSSGSRERPILDMSKKDLQMYAKTHNLSWVEDHTNIDPKYLRNKIRLALSKRSEVEHDSALTMLAQIAQKNDLLDKEIATILQYRLKNIAIISRSWFVKLPHVVAAEIVHAVLSRIGVKNINRQLVERMVVAIKVHKPGTRFDIDGQTIGMATKRSFRIVDRSTLEARRL